MTLSQTIDRIELAASKQMNVHTLVRNDIFRINAKPDVKYGCLAWTQGQHSSDEILWRFSFSLIYVDRLTDDKSNQVEIQSVGISTIDNIIKILADEGIELEGTPSYTTFNQRFLDECAGVFCNVSFSVPKNYVCADVISGDYNRDFNDDFLIM